MLTTSRIPLIDLGGHIDPDRAAARETAWQLYDALSTIGFAYITGHTVSPTVREAAFDASRAFHMSSPTQKQSLAINGFHRGYVGLATSTIVTSSVAKVTRPNMSASIMLMHELPADDPGVQSGAPMQGPNQWPDWIPGFKPTVQQFIAEVDALGRYIIQLIAMRLDLPARALDHYFDKPTTFLRMLHYPPQPPNTTRRCGMATT